MSRYVDLVGRDIIRFDISAISMHFGRSVEVHCREYLYDLLCIELLSNILHILQSDFLLNFYLLASKSAKCSCEPSVSGSQ